MEAKEIKKLIALAKRSGIIKLKVDGFEIEFAEDVIKPKVVKPVLVTESKDVSTPQTKPITLDDINDYIYSQDVESDIGVHFV